MSRSGELLAQIRAGRDWFSDRLAEGRRQEKHAESTTRLLLRIGAVAESSDDFESAALGILELFSNELWPAGHVYTRVGDTFVDTDLWTQRTQGVFPGLPVALKAMSPQFPIRSTASSRAVLTATGPLWSTRAPTPPGSSAVRVGKARHDLMREHGVGTGIACPVDVRGEVVGFLELLSPRAWRTEPAALGALQVAAVLLGGVAERQAAARRLAEQHEMWQLIAEKSPDALTVYDTADRSVILWSPGRNAAVSTQKGPLGELWKDEDIDFAPWGGRDGFIRELVGTGGPVVLRVFPTTEPPQLWEIYHSTVTVGDRRLGVISSRDVAEREQTARALEDVSARSHALLDMIDVGVYDVDCAGTILYTNPAGARLLRRSQDAHAGAESGGGEDGTNSPRRSAPEVVGTKLTEHAPFLEDVLASSIDSSRDLSGPGLRPVVRSSGELRSREGLRLPVAAAVTSHRRSDGYTHTVVTLADVTEAEESARLAVQHAHALELNDGVVQGVATALYGIELGEIDHATAALQQTLRTAKDTVSTLLAGEGVTSELLRQVAARTEAANADSAASFDVRTAADSRANEVPSGTVHDPREAGKEGTT